ncbi:hypothetical protein B0H11DRAFT_833838 [Mycena galericulata]|nr:hypothetical protein B0H11DRAFT_833838 [Mycena galericulata]
MSSRAASGRKKLRPVPAAPPLSTLPQSTQSTTNPFNRSRTDSDVLTASPQASRTPVSPMHSRSAPSPSPSTPSSLSSSGFPYQPPSRGLIPRSQRAFEPSGGGEVTPYPLPSQAPPYQPPPLRKDKKGALRAANPSSDPPALHPAPSYSSVSVHFADSDGGDSRRPSSRALPLPPYPSPPNINTGWAALSDTKVASAFAGPPSYPEDPQEPSDPYPSLPLQSSIYSQPNIARSGSVASSSRLPPLETSGSDSHPPYYSPSSSPPVPLSRLPAHDGLGAGSPRQQKRVTFTYSPATSYPTPHSSSFSSPSTSLASLPAVNNRLDTHHESNTSGSSDSISGGSLASSARRANPAMQSRQSVSSSSSDDPAPTTQAAPPANTPFVFPSSRSRARPSGTAPGVSGFKFRGRRKLKAPLATVQVLAPGTPIPSEGVFTARPQPRSQQVAQAAPPGNPRLRASPQDLRLAPIPAVGSASSGSGPSSPTTAAAPAAPTFYFPSSRTRAHPKSATQFTFKTGKKKDGEKQPGFLGMGIRRRKIVVPASPTAVSAEGPPSPMEKTFSTSSPSEERPGTLTSEPRVSYEDLDTAPPPSQVVPKIGTYPLDAYDAALIDSDRQTCELLRKLNATNTPSFHNYGGRPPHYVLDLGCGAGHWILDAAIAWRNSGTQIIGFDMVDTTKGLWPLAQRQGVANNIKFVRGNFVKQPLPFPDGYFQLVRMASLALCVPHEKWEFVLQEACRVLAVGGRLEFIDDHVFFPYGKPALLNAGVQPPPPAAPHLDLPIPSTEFSRMSLADVVNPGARDDMDSEIYNLYGVEEEEEEHSDADTVASSSGRRRGTPTPHRGSSSTSSLSGLSPENPEMWHEQAAAARELEELFEHMMNVKYGIHLQLSDFIFDMMARAFGGAKEITTMHLTLAPPDQSTVQGHESHLPGQHSASLVGRPRGRSEQPGQSQSTPESDTLGHCPGLILWPSTFIPMPLSELEIHASKHLRALLSCKSALVDYAAELADQDEGEIQSEAAMEALWEYQNFLRERFNPPPDDPTRGMSDSSEGDANSVHNSIFSVSSIESEALDAMRDYQSELNSRFEWSSDAGRARREATPNNTTPRTSVIEAPDAPPRPRKSRSRGSRGRDRAMSMTSAVSSVAPPYSRIELTHVRTFYVYEAVKLAEGRFGGVR